MNLENYIFKTNFFLKKPMVTEKKNLYLVLGQCCGVVDKPLPENLHPVWVSVHVSAVLLPNPPPC